MIFNLFDITKRTIKFLEQKPIYLKKPKKKEKKTLLNYRSIKLNKIDLIELI